MMNPFKIIMHLVRLSGDIRYSRSSTVIVIIMGLVSGACNTGLIILINHTLNNIGVPHPKLVLGFIVLCLLLPLSRFISEILLIGLAAKAMSLLRIQLCRRILAAPLSLLEQLGAHRLMASLTDDAPTIANALIAVPVLCMHVAMLLGCLIYLGWLSWTLLLGVVAVMIIGIISYQLPMMKALGYYARARDLTDDLFHNFRALTSGTKELKLHRERRAVFFSDYIEPTSEAMFRQTLFGNMINTAAASWGHVLFFVVIGLLLFALPSQKSASMETLTGYILTLLYMMTPLQIMLNTIPSLSRADVAMQKIEALGLSLSSHQSDIGASARSDENPAWTSLEMRGVTHHYTQEMEGSDFTLGPVDLALSPGELVFLIGGNGSGKTTLAKILTGLYSPETGVIRFNGENVTHDNRDLYRQNFSVIFADFYLFENLIGLDDQELDARASRYLAQLQLQHKVRVKDGALSTIDLSQGQRKRLALLTAYLEDRPIYVFDEWAADQDPLFREIFYFQVLPELIEKGKTVIVISHDDRYYHLAHRIIRLDYGKIEYDRYNTPAVDAVQQVALPSGK